MSESFAHNTGNEHISELSGSYLRADNTLIQVSKTGMVLIELVDFKIESRFGVWCLDDSKLERVDKTGILWTGVDGTHHWWRRIDLNMKSLTEPPISPSNNNLNTKTEEGAPILLSPTHPTFLSATPLQTTTKPKIPDNKVLGTLPFRQLNETEFLTHHLNGIERIGKEINLFINDQCEDVHAHLETQFSNKIIESLKLHPDMVSYANRVQQARDGYRWIRLKKALLERFAAPEFIETAYKKKLSLLRFKGLFDYEEYISQCSTLLALVQQLYPDNQGERRLIVREFMRQLPIVERELIVMELKKYNRREWESLPFDNEEDLSGLHATTIVEAIRMVFQAKCDARLLNDSGTRHNEKPSPQLITQDRNRLIQESPTRTFIDQFNETIHISGKETANNAATQALLTAAGVPESSIRFLKNKKGYAYGLVGFPHPGIGEQKVIDALKAKQLPQQYRVSVFGKYKLLQSDAKN